MLLDSILEKNSSIFAVSLFYVLRSTFYVLRSTFYVLRSTFYVLRLKSQTNPPNSNLFPSPTLTIKPRPPPPSGLFQFPFFQFYFLSINFFNLSNYEFFNDTQDVK